MLSRVIEVHTQAILRFYQVQLQRGPIRVFAPEGKVVLVSESGYKTSWLQVLADVTQGGYHSLRVHLCADEVAIVSIDTRTGRLNLRDTGDLAAAGRGPRFSAISDKLNDAPNMLFDVLIRLRYNVRTILFLHRSLISSVYWQTITDIVEQKANYLGFQVFRHRNFSKEGLALSAHIHCPVSLPSQRFKSLVPQRAA